MSKQGNGNGKAGAVSPGGPLSLPPAIAEKNQLLDDIHAIHLAYALAQQAVEARIGNPICIPNCGLCCQHNSIVAWGMESYFTAAWLWGQPKLIKPVLDRARDWLTEPGQWTYGRKISAGAFDKLARVEMTRAMNTRCCWLTEENGCLIHGGRPIVCRAYGVTRESPESCPRPLNPVKETGGKRIYADARSADLPIYNFVMQLQTTYQKWEYARQGFLANLLYMHFRTQEYTGLIDDGKIPIVKAISGWGDDLTLLFQHQVENLHITDAQLDEALKAGAKTVEVDGQLVRDLGKVVVE